MPPIQKRKSKALNPLGTLPVEQLIGLAAELQKLRSHPPLVKRSDGRYEGDILGFVKGLRFSARMIYFLREHLSHTDLEVSWGHLVDDNEQSCSPECDIIIHKKGQVRKWNGSVAPVMEFKFVKASNALAVVSCKSKATSIDKRYPKDLKSFGIKNIFLFAECCRKKDFKRLSLHAKNAGYGGFWSLYYAEDDDPGYVTDETQYADFGNRVLAATNQKRRRPPR
jgi:hypothetical protein